MSVATQPCGEMPSAEEGSEEMAPYGQLVGLRDGLATLDLVEQSYSFGRTADNDVVFAKNAEVSGGHCTVAVDDEGVVCVTDTSTNGTFIDGERIPKGESCELRNGSELALGVKNAAQAKKTTNHKTTFVAYVFRSAVGDEQLVHEAFREAEGPNQTYSCAKELGSGAFAQVHLCLHRRTGRKYAAKIVDKGKFALNKELRKDSFRDEVEILKTIQSPYIVQVHDIYETKRFLTIILQYVSGGDLFDKVVSLKRFAEDDAKIVFKQMAEGLKYLHERGIAHRDLKPENFLITSHLSDVHVLMGDFGLARVFSNNESYMKTLCGTPQYLAPEVVQQARASKMEGYTSAVDVWALGVILYVLLCGQPPFSSQDFDAIVAAEFNFDNRKWNTVSAEAKALIKRMMARDPEDRATIEQVCADEWLQNVEIPLLADDDQDVVVATTSSQAARVRPSPKKPEEAGAKLVHFEEQTRAPTTAAVGSKIQARAATGMGKRLRDAIEEEEEEEEEDKKQKPEEAMDEKSLKRLKVAELRAKCQERGLDTTGIKAVLIERILGE